MVPSRSRKTAGRSAFVSGKTFAPGGAFQALSEGQGRSRRFKDAVNGNAGHTPMVDGAFSEETGAAIHLLANKSELRGQGPSALGIGGAKDRDYGNSYGAGDVH